jgi:hypothetical protein
MTSILIFNILAALQVVAPPGAYIAEIDLGAVFFIAATQYGCVAVTSKQINLTSVHTEQFLGRRA